MKRDPAIRVTLLPRDTNKHGTIFGGIILEHVDLAGSVEAQRNGPHRFVTVCMKEVVFKAPIFVGDLVSFYAKTRKVGNTSVTVVVDVEAERPDGALVDVTSAEIVYVAVDQGGRPVPVKGKGKE